MFFLYDVCSVTYENPLRYAEDTPRRDLLGASAVCRGLQCTRGDPFLPHHLVSHASKSLKELGNAWKSSFEAY